MQTNDLCEWGTVLIDGYWRAAPVGGAQWFVAEWRVRVGTGRSGALAAVKKAKMSNQFRSDHPTNMERLYNCRKSQPQPDGFNVTPSSAPSVVQITTEGVNLIDIRPETAITTDQARRAHPDWQAVGHPVTVKIGSNYVDVARSMGKQGDRPTISQAIHRLIYAGLTSQPPAVHDRFRSGGGS